MRPGHYAALLLVLLSLSAPLSAQGPVYEVGVDGLACPFCAYGIEKQLYRLEGVDKAETRVKQGVVIVRMEEGQELDKQQVEQAVTKAGFTLRSFKEGEQSP